MKIEKFEDIISWQKAKVLTNGIYKEFSSCKDFSFRDQIQRAVISVMNNIAEGFERRTNKDFSYFLYIAKGSCGEVRSMLYVALERKYINQKAFDEFYKLSVEISKIISSFIKKL